jgi:hypothetical protein
MEKLKTKEACKKQLQLSSRSILIEIASSMKPYHFIIMIVCFLSELHLFFTIKIVKLHSNRNAPTLTLKTN